MRAMRMDPAGRFPTLAHMGAALLPFASETARLLWAGVHGEVAKLNELQARVARAADRWAEKKSAAELAAYRAEKNAVSIDGLPALDATGLSTERR